MKVINTVDELTAALAVARENGRTIGLVPTMGALHSGHESLIKKCVRENGISVVSVFVNPTQFNNIDDLNSYPRDLEKDKQLLLANNVDIVFAPSVEEMYPEPDHRVFSYAPLDTVMEGIYRPGHFNGVCQVVSKLFNYVRPDKAYFGEKDFQQLAIIRRMALELFPTLEIVGCPIMRENGGLALSSRNQLLTSEQRSIALNISRILSESAKLIDYYSLEEVALFVTDSISNTAGLEIEYFEIVDGDNLQRVKKWSDSPYIVGCITVYCGKVRLIDNITYKNRKTDYVD